MTNDHAANHASSRSPSAECHVWIVEGVIANLDDEDSYADGDWFVESVWADEHDANRRAVQVSAREEYQCVDGAFCAWVEGISVADPYWRDQYGTAFRPRLAAVVRRCRVQ